MAWCWQAKGLMQRPEHHCSHSHAINLVAAIAEDSAYAHLYGHGHERQAGAVLTLSHQQVVLLRVLQRPKAEAD